MCAAYAASAPWASPIAARWSPSARHACGRSGFSATARRSAATASSPCPAWPSARPSSQWASAHFGCACASGASTASAWRASPRAVCEAPSTSNAIGWSATTRRISRACSPASTGSVASSRVAWASAASSGAVGAGTFCSLMDQRAAPMATDTNAPILDSPQLYTPDGLERQRGQCGVAPQPSRCVPQDPGRAPRHDHPARNLRRPADARPAARVAPCRRHVAFAFHRLASSRLPREVPRCPCFDSD